MIRRTTKIQLAAFVAVTLLFMTIVGSKYAQVDRLVLDRDYDVTMQLAESGGIFAGAHVTYRGVGVGKVSDLDLTDDGVAATLKLEKSGPDIPADLVAVVANKSAVGEQFVDLQPATDDEPYLEDGSVIAAADTRTPLPTQTLISNSAAFVGSVDTDNLRIAVRELGTAFEGSGNDLANIIETSNSFLKTADENFGVTAKLIRDSTTVLGTQIDSAGSISAFSRDLALFSDSLAASDDDLRTVLDDTGPSLDQFAAALAENEKKIGELLDDLVGTNRVIRTRLPGIKGILELAPFAVEAGFSAVVKDDATGKYGVKLALSTSPSPGYCFEGYPLSKVREANDTSTKPMPTDALCTAPASETNARGTQNIQGNPVAGTYDPGTGEFEAFDPTEVYESSPLDTAPTDASAESGEGSWKQLMAPGMIEQ